MRIGFIGVGGIANSYRNSLKRLNRPITAVCDLNGDRARQVAAEHGAASYADHRQMLDRESLDVVFVCIPPGAHDRQVVDAAESGCHLFVAKPVALDLPTALRAQAAIRAAGVINQVGYMARYSDLTEKTRQVVGDRPLGLGIGRFMCRMGASHPWWGKSAVSGGQMLEQSTHVFDLLRYFLGEVREAQAFGHKGLGDDIADFEDSTVCNLHFANGSIGNVASTCCANTPDGFAAEISGRDIYLKLVMDTRLRGVVENQPVEYDGVETGYHRQVEMFIRAVEARDQNLVRSSYSDAVRTLAVTLAANRSLSSGKPEAVEETSA